MKLLFIHGAPASGKLTVAKAVLRAVPGKLFDNHASIDVARTIFDFDEPGFWELVHEVRSAVLKAAIAQNTPFVVTTYCYADPDDLPILRDFEAIVEGTGGELLPVFLHCSREEAMRRVGNPDRAARRKMTSPEKLNAMLERDRLIQVPRDDCISLATDARSPEATAQEIIRRFRLA